MKRLFRLLLGSSCAAVSEVCDQILNRSSRSRLALMALLRDTNLALWPKGSLKSIRLNIKNIL